MKLRNLFILAVSIIFSLFIMSPKGCNPEDIEAPVVTIDEPQDGSAVPLSTEIQAIITVTDDVGVAAVGAKIVSYDAKGVETEIFNQELPVPRQCKIKYPQVQLTVPFKTPDTDFDHITISAWAKDCSGKEAQAEDVTLVQE